MKTKIIKQQSKNMKQSSRTLSNKNVASQRFSLLNKLPIITLDHIASYLNGSDALSFNECLTKFILISERNFWQSLGP